MGNSFPRPVDDIWETCTTFHDPNGELFWQYLGRGLQWLTFVISWGQLAFYGYQSFRTTMGWEETYVCVVEGEINWSPERISSLAHVPCPPRRTTLDAFCCVTFAAAIKITVDIFFMYSTPATIYQSNGNTVSWLTYSEWLLTCPVCLLIMQSVLVALTHRQLSTLTALDVRRPFLSLFAGHPGAAVQHHWSGSRFQ